MHHAIHKSTFAEIADVAQALVGKGLEKEQQEEQERDRTRCQSGGLARL